MKREEIRMIHWSRAYVVAMEAKQKYGDDYCYVDIAAEALAEFDRVFPIPPPTCGMCGDDCRTWNVPDEDTDYQCPKCKNSYEFRVGDGWSLKGKR